LKKEDFTAATGRRLFSDLRKRIAPERRARNAEATKHMLALHELRQARELSHEELARELKVGQPAVAELECRTDMYVSNLRRYIEISKPSMRSLEITARFPEGTVNITNFGDPDNDEEPWDDLIDPGDCLVATPPFLQALVSQLTGMG
jgi:transcriptional regulator with XRE-family HTH domain